MLGNVTRRKCSFDDDVFISASIRNQGNDGAIKNGFIGRPGELFSERAREQRLCSSFIIVLPFV